MTSILEKFNDGGILITYTIFVLFVVIIILFVKGLANKGDNAKTISLIASIAWFALAWGYLGRTFGLIEAFDNIQAAGDIAPNLLAGGIKKAILGPLFGIITFIVARLGIIILVWKKKQD